MQKNDNNRHYLLIADSGSTKTTWCIASEDSERIILNTGGINPVVQDDTAIHTLLTEELLPQLKSSGLLPGQVGGIYFYGAGCLPSVCERMKNHLRKIIPEVTAPEVESDLLGAARALCGHSAGIACILGTGSNSCFYNGKEIMRHISPLGYILGDEGSGATLGKHFISNLLKGLLAQELYEAFAGEYGLTEGDIIRKVYREANANRFLASLTIFIHKHRQHPDIHDLVTACFRDFFHRNVDAYGTHDLPVHFTGSIAFHFHEELKEATHDCNYQIGKLIPSPIHDITNFHLQIAEESALP